MHAGYPVTARAACNALGMSTEAVLAGLHAGQTGLSSAPFELPFVTAVGALPGPLPPLRESLSGFDTRLTRIAAWLAAELRIPLARAIAAWGAPRVAIVIASSTAGIGATEQAFGVRLATGSLPAGYSLSRTHSFQAVVEVLRAESGARGPGYVVSTACSSSNKVFGAAQRLLSAGFADAVLVGGIDTLCQTTLRGFHSLGILSSQPCRPFGRDRDGVSIGEGGALLLLERHGQGSARLLGVGETSDAHHMTQPHPEGAGARAAMELALSAAALSPGDIDHVNAHGTGTPLNDTSEALAILGLFGPRVPVASTKGYTGHMLGAAAAVEAVFAIDAIERGRLPLSLGADPPDPAIGVQLIRASTQQRCRHVLSNAFAFGGSNAAVVFGASA